MAHPLDVLPQACVYSAVVDSYRNAGDHVEYCVCARHSGDAGSWRVWRRFAAFRQLCDELSAQFGRDPRVPDPPRRVWLPQFVQGVSSDFCEARQRELHKLLTSVLAVPEFATHAAVQAILGVQPPTPPADVQLIAADPANFNETGVPAASRYLLELTPAADQAAPVEGYSIEVVHIGTGLRRAFFANTSGPSLEWERLRGLVTDGTGGRRKPFLIHAGLHGDGEHKLKVAAMNYAGRSTSLTITVDTAILAGRPCRPDTSPNEELAVLRELLESERAESQRMKETVRRQHDELRRLRDDKTHQLGYHEVCQHRDELEKTVKHQRVFLRRREEFGKFQAAALLEYRGRHEWSPGPVIHALDVGDEPASLNLEDSVWNMDWASPDIAGKALQLRD